MLWLCLALQGVTTCKSVVVCVLIVLLYLSRAVYNIIAVTAPHSLSSFGYGWINISDEVRRIDCTVRPGGTVYVIQSTLSKADTLGTKATVRFREVSALERFPLQRYKCNSARRGPNLLSGLESVRLERVDCIRLILQRDLIYDSS